MTMWEFNILMTGQYNSTTIHVIRLYITHHYFGHMHIAIGRPGQAMAISGGTRSLTSHLRLLGVGCARAVLSILILDFYNKLPQNNSSSSSSGYHILVLFLCEFYYMRE